MSSDTEASAGLRAEAFPAKLGKNLGYSSPSSSGEKKQRLLGIDVTRGLALLGMMAVHALLPYDENFDPNWVTYVALGNAAAVLAVLAGVGLSLSTERAVVPRSKAMTTAAGVAGRAVTIGLIGLLLGYSDSSIAGVILPYYAVLFVLAIPLLFLRTRTLVLVGTFAAVAVPVLSHWVRPAMPETLGGNLNFLDLVDHPLLMLCQMLVTGTYPALPWMSYICAGLIIGRLTLSSVKVAHRMMIFGVGLVATTLAASWYLLGPLGGRAALRLAEPGPLNGDGDTVDDLLVFGFSGTTPTGSWWWLATSAPHAGTPLDLLHTIGIAVAVLGAMLLLDHVTVPALRRVINVVVTPIGAAGSMTLTLYTAHIVFMNSPLDHFSPMGGYLFQVVGVLSFALWWKQAVGRGPLEAVVTGGANWARACAERVTSQERVPAKARRNIVDTSEQETLSWQDDESEGSPTHSPTAVRPRRATSHLERKQLDQD